MNTETLALQYGEYTIIEPRNTRLLVFKNSKIYRWSKGGYWKFVYNTANTNTGYNQIRVGKKDEKNLTMILRHRLMAYAFLNLDINNPTLQIDHIDGNRINNHIDNLRIVNHQQNQWNRTTAKGYYYNKKYDKYQAQIAYNTSVKNLGYYDTEEEARQAYLNAKIIYHPI
jgi:hypothetical protein